MSLVQGTSVPAARLCQAILYCGGGTGEKTTVPVNPAVAHDAWALPVFVPTRWTTVQTTFGDGLGVATGVAVGAGVGVGTGVTTAVGVGTAVGFTVGVGRGVGTGVTTGRRVDPGAV